MLPAALAAGVLAGLAFGVGGSLAGEGDSATAQFRKNRDECAAPSDHKFIGTAKVTENGNKITVKATLHGAEPGEYQLQLWVPFPIPAFRSATSESSRWTPAATAARAARSRCRLLGATYFLDAYNRTTGTDNDTDIFDL